jgi:hypothetical protein
MKFNIGDKVYPKRGCRFPSRQLQEIRFTAEHLEFGIIKEVLSDARYDVLWTSKKENKKLLSLAREEDLLEELKVWSDEVPRNIWVWARYSNSSDLFLAKTCLRGCCVYSDGDNLCLPDFWKECTQEEADAEQKRCDKINPIDLSSLYVYD